MSATYSPSGNDHLPELLTVKETAEYLRIPLPTVYYLIKGARLPAIQIGGRWRIKRSRIDAAILEQDRSPATIVLDPDEDTRSTSQRLLTKNRCTGVSHARLTDFQHHINQVLLSNQRPALIVICDPHPDAPITEILTPLYAEERLSHTPIALILDRADAQLPNVSSRPLQYLQRKHLLPLLEQHNLTRPRTDAQPKKTQPAANAA